MSELRMYRSAMVFLGLVLAYGLTPRAESQAEPAADFGFRLEVGDCLNEKFDSFRGEFWKNVGAVRARSATTRLSLTEFQMRTIYQDLEKIRFFDIPSPFNGVPSDISVVATTSPASTYRLEVRNGGVVHTVVWNDAYSPTTAQADRLRTMLSTIIGFIHDQPNFKQLPHAIGGCE